MIDQGKTIHTASYSYNCHFASRNSYVAAAIQSYDMRIHKDSYLVPVLLVDKRWEKTS